MSSCAVCERPIDADQARRYSGFDYCPECFHSVTHYKIPLWVKTFAIGLALLVGVGLAIDSRFYRALTSIRAARASLNAGKLDDALAASDIAARLVPESGELGTLNEYYRGINLFTKGKLEEALPLLQDYARFEPDDKVAESIVLGIQLGKDFDAHDYASMRDKARKLWELDKSDPERSLQYASALACVYVSAGDATARDEALGLIAAVKAKGDYEGKARMDAYIERIEYRIDKKLIISTEEYDRRKR
jgi:tetratricopeptide (TPR) repeat protein